MRKTVRSLLCRLLSPAALLAVFSAPLGAQESALPAGSQPAPHELRIAVGKGLESAALRMLKDNPLPLPWTFSIESIESETEAEAGASAQTAAAVPSAALVWRPVSREPDPAAVRVLLGRRWKAAPLSFLDSRSSLSRDEAIRAGLVDLARIELPQRAAEVDGLWPGEAGYPFEDWLELSVSGAEGSLSGWISSLSRQYAGKSPLPGAQARPIVLGATGDIVFGSAEAPLLSQGEEGLKTLFGNLLPIMRKEDILVGNLEGVVSIHGKGNPRKRFQFRFPLSTPEALTRAGFDLVLVGNNHVFDFGMEAFEDTLFGLAAAALPAVGGGMTLNQALEAGAAGGIGADASAPLFIGFGSFHAENYGFTTAEAAATATRPGINADEDATCRAISKLSKSGRMVIVLAHGGSEYRFEPAREIKRRYRRFVDAGAAAVIGSHPHVLQGAESYRSGFIAYSLGNFIFTADIEPPESRASAILELLIGSGKVKGMRLVPVRAGEHATALDSEPSATWKAFLKLSSQLAQ